MTTLTLSRSAIDAATGDDDASRSVLGRAAAIVGAFAGDSSVRTLTELTDQTRMPKSTVHRIADQLVALGWLERDVAGYRVGMRLFEFGGLAGRRNRLRDPAAPHLHRLAAVTGLSVNFGILDDLDVVYLERIPVQGMPLPIRDGARMPSYCTGLGKALLADADHATLDEVVRRGLMRRTSNTITDEREWRAEIESICASGVAHDQEECFEGVRCVAVPVRGSGRPIAAISVVGAPGSFDPHAVQQALVQTASVVWQAIFSKGSSAPRLVDARCKAS